MDALYIKSILGLSGIVPLGAIYLPHRPVAHYWPLTFKASVLRVQARACARAI